jgi:hypothetical protein
MIQKRASKMQTMRIERNAKKYPIIGRLMFYLSTIILLSGLFYMIVNLSIADSIIDVWLPIMIAGTVLIFISSLILNKTIKR